MAPTHASDQPLSFSQQAWATSLGGMLARHEVTPAEALSVIGEISRNGRATITQVSMLAKRRVARG